MKIINILLIILICNFCHSQIKLVDNDTIDTKYYDKNDKTIKSFTYRKQFITSQSGEMLSVFFDSICGPIQKQKIISYKSANRQYNFYQDSLVIRNWDMHNTPIQNKEHFQLSILLKSKKFSNIGISLEYNRNDSLCRRLLITKPDTLTFYTKEIYFDLNFHDTKLKSPHTYKINNDRFLFIYFNKENFIERLHYEVDNEKTVIVEFKGFYIPVQYGYRNSKSLQRIGTWYTYYDSGKLSSIGDYCGNDFDYNGNEKNLKKTGKWIYFSERGCIEKEENWKNGELLAPSTKQKTKTK